MDAASLLSYKTPISVGDGSWKGSMHTFVLHWLDKIRKYEDLTTNSILMVQKSKVGKCR